MRAVQITGPQELDVVQVDRPRVTRPSDAVVMVTTAGLGPIDIERFRQGNVGVIPGGEFCGNVVEIGADVRTVDLDDLVFGTTAVDGDPTRRFGMEIDGGHAEYVLVPDADLALVKTNAASEERSVLAGGTLGLGAAATETAIKELPEDGMIAVVGCDPCGMSAVAWLRRRSIAGVIAYDTHPARSTLAKRFRATLVESLESAVRADVVIAGEIADGPGIESVAQMAKPGGVVVFCRPGELAEWDARLNASEIRALEAKWPNSQFATGVVRAVHTRRLDLTAAVSHVIPLDDASEAYEAAAGLAPGVQKVLLKP